MPTESILRNPITTTPRSSSPVSRSSFDSLSLSERSSTRSSTESSNSTSSSHSSHSSHSSQSSHKSGKSSLHSLFHPGSHAKDKKEKRDSLPYSVEHLRTPQDLAEAVVKSVVTIPGPPIDVLREEIWPRLLHATYSHRVNTRETDIEGLEACVFCLRGRFRSVRVRVKSTLMDSDGTASMKAAAVGLSYEVLGIPKDAPKHEAEEKRMPAMAVIKVLNGKVAQTDMVLDTTQFHASTGPTELSCTVM